MKKITAFLIAIITVCAMSTTAFASEEQTPADQTSASEQKTETTASAETSGVFRKEKHKTTTVAEETQISAELSEEAALAAALKDAGESEASVTVTKNYLAEKKTKENEKVAVYTIMFSNDTTSCKYLVDANNGEILYKKIVYHNSDIDFSEHGHKEKIDTDIRSDNPSSAL